ncbi:MAG: DUF488 domain-containing protein [Methanobacteriaceae archaeon]|jgi:uncharacterized protein (DUF488 family)|nr:DUF488 domain-containing protein [Methanobacteriaceae archaeon]
MKVFTIGSSGQKAEEFFKIINENKIEVLLDVRLHNYSQLLGFTKGIDLGYFLDVISNCKYIHDKDFCTTEEVLIAYRKKEIEWVKYKAEYLKLMKKRDMINLFHEKYGNPSNIMLLCSEKEPDTCHRILLADGFADSKKDISHL